VVSAQWLWLNTVCSIKQSLDLCYFVDSIGFSGLASSLASGLALGLQWVKLLEELHYPRGVGDFSISLAVVYMTYGRRLMI
jgi:hypothetical protein